MAELPRSAARLRTGPLHFVEVAPGRRAGHPGRRRHWDGKLTGSKPCRVVLFSQIKECANVIETFVCHYAALGFHKLLLYLDDPEDIALLVLQQSGWIDSGFVEVVLGDEALKASWPSLPSWGRVGSHAGMEVQSRQILNCEHALKRCGSREVAADWLLHVDSDELLCLPEPAPAFFGKLSAGGCTMFTFNNVEGVPEVPDSTDVLRSVRVFRQNLGLIPRNPAAGIAFFDWQLRLGGWFISYENGKSAVNVKHALKCLSVCMWEVHPQLLPGKGKEMDGSTCTWYTNNRTLWDAAVKRRQEGRLHPEEEVPRFFDASAVVLHFCVCDFASFWRKRWTQLGYLSASDQFRVRASSGAMMSRFYRLQREGRQGEARALYESMCVCADEATLANHSAAGVLLRLAPEQPAGPSGPRWPRSPRPVAYEQLADIAAGKGKSFDAWMLRGKAVDLAAEEKRMGPEALAGLHVTRAQEAIASGLPATALEDFMEALHLGRLGAVLPLTEALEALGRSSLAQASAEEGLRKVLRSSSKEALELAEPLKALIKRLRADAKKEPSKSSSSSGLRLPTPTELQQYVAQAVRPDAKDSRLYRAMLPVAMSWWQEVGGDEKHFLKALQNAANAAREDLKKVDACERPRPSRQVRELWDAHYTSLRESGVLACDLQSLIASTISEEAWKHSLAACAKALEGGSASSSASVKACHLETSPLHWPWLLAGGFVAEVGRAFGIREMRVLTELAVAKPGAARAPGPTVDNGGLLPDNRREVSCRLFLPLKPQGGDRAPGTLVLSAKDGEKSLSFELQGSQAFVWWSRQTFHQVLGGEGCCVISCWGVVPQKDDLPSQGR